MSKRSSAGVRLRSIRLCTLGALAAVLATIAVHVADHSGAARAAGAGAAEPTSQPVLGTADRGAVLMGAAMAGTPGEAWAYRVLPLDVPPPAGEASGRMAFAPAPKVAGGTPPGQLVFECASDTDPDWQICETPLGEGGQPYRGLAPDRLSARIAPHGGGLLVGNDPTRAVGKQVVTLARNPGGRFQMLSEPPIGVLLGAGEGGTGEPAETLALNEGTGAVVDAAIEDEGRTEAYFGALGRTRETAVIHWNGQHWSREPVKLPTGYEGGFQILGIAGSAPDNLWLLGQANQASGLGIMLFKRASSGGEPSWEPVGLGAPLFEQAATPAKGVSGLAPLAGQSQPLTVDEQGVWIDGNLQLLGAGSDGYDFTLFYDIAAGRVTGSWCDARDSGGEALCEHPLGARFGRLSGYRSFAFDGPGFGSRIITNPLQPGGEDSTNMGAYLRLEGTSFRWMPGAGPDDAPGGAFFSPVDGWLEGPVQVTAQQQPQRLASWPVSARAPFTAVASAPGAAPGALGSQALAVGADGVVARYTAGQGWVREFLLTSSGAVSSPTLRAVAWPEANRAYAVGDLGAMWLWRAETGLWEKDPEAPPGFQGNLLGVAFDPNEPATGYAVGLEGVLLKFNKTWEQLNFSTTSEQETETLPEGFREANFTSVAFAGSEALVAAGSDLLVRSGSGHWEVQPEVHALLASLPGGTPQLYTVAGLANGGAVAAGRDVVLERDSASSPWHFSEQPIVDETAVAAAPYMEGSHLRAVLSVVPEVQYPPPLILPPVDPNTPPPLIPPNPLAGDGYVLRETTGGWEDEQRAAYAGDTEDKPIKADPIAALDVGPEGAGWAVGGWSGELDDAGRGTAASGGAGQAIRENVQTAGIYRYAPEGNAPGPPDTSTAPTPLEAGVATFAVAGHAECAQPCAELADVGIAPDRNLSAALGAIGGLSTQPNGPRMLLYTGGRETPGEGPESAAEANRFAQLLSQSGGLPVYPALSQGDSEGGEAGAFTAAFASFAAPFGEGATPAGVSAANVPAASAAPAPGARTHYAFDSTGPTGTVRVIVIDNSRGSLAASDPYQNPAEPQAPWLERMLASAKQQGIPAIVVGSRELNPDLPPALNVASDANEEAQIMLQGGASAYLYERPEESRTSQIPAGAQTTIPEFGTGALGYRSAVSDSFTAGQPDALFGTTGYLLLSVNVAQRNPTTNVAPVNARLIPLMQSLSLDPVDGTLLRRSAPALFQGLGRRPLAGDRWGPVSASSGSPSPPGANPYSVFPPTQCLQSDCSSAIEPEYTFTSSEPEIANFVEQDPNTTNLRKPLQDSAGHVIPDSHSGILCAFNAGSTVVTISAGGLSYSVGVTVLGGSVEQPCGTVPLSPSRFAKAASAAASPPPPPPAPAPAPAPAPLAPPPLPPAVVTSPPPVRPVPRLPPPAALLFPPLALVVPQSALPVIPPPPAAGFARPIPPGGATIRVFEEKREEESAPETSQAFARYYPPAYGSPATAHSYQPAYASATAHSQRPVNGSSATARYGSRQAVARRGWIGAATYMSGSSGGSLPALYLFGAVILAAVAGASVRLHPRRRLWGVRAALAESHLYVDARLPAYRLSDQRLLDCRLPDQRLPDLQDSRLSSRR